MSNARKFLKRVETEEEYRARRENMSGVRGLKRSRSPATFAAAAAPMTYGAGASTVPRRSQRAVTIETLNRRETQVMTAEGSEAAYVSMEALGSHISARRESGLIRIQKAGGTEHAIYVYVRGPVKYVYNANDCGDFKDRVRDMRSDGTHRVEEVEGRIVRPLMGRAGNNSHHNIGAQFLTPGVGVCCLLSKCYEMYIEEAVENGDSMSKINAALVSQDGLGLIGRYYEFKPV